MNIGFILHLYQPSFQDEATVNKIARESYYPLLKFIRSRRDVNLTLNIPLSLLEVMEKYGFKDWIEDVEDLYKKERIELIGSAAYHPILPMIPEWIAEDEIMLNEYGLGYYLGSKQDFEGEPALMLKDINGFFPPELAVNESVVKIVSSLGYKWIVVSNMAIIENNTSDKSSDESSFNNPSAIYQLDGYECKLVTRDNALSNLISFKRELDITDIVDYLNSYTEENIIIAMDGEFFGHHYKDGITLLEMLSDKIKIMRSEYDFVSNIVSTCDHKKIENIHESTWSTTTIADRVSTSYPLWFNESNIIQNLMYELECMVMNMVQNNTIEYKKEYKGDKKSLWEDNDIERNYREIHRFICSDKYWWLSRKIMPRGEYLYDKMFVKECMKNVENIINRLGDEAKLTIKNKYEKVIELLNE